MLGHVDERELYGEKYKLVRGKGYGHATWWVFSKDGRSEVAGGLYYAQAKEIFDSCESSVRKPGQVRASMNPAIIDLEDQQRRESRSSLRKRGIIVD